MLLEKNRALEGANMALKTQAADLAARLAASEAAAAAASLTAQQQRGLIAQLEGDLGRVGGAISGGGQGGGSGGHGSGLGLAAQALAAAVPTLVAGEGVAGAGDGGGAAAAEAAQAAADPDSILPIVASQVCHGRLSRRHGRCRWSMAAHDYVGVGVGGRWLMSAGGAA